MALFAIVHAALIAGALCIASPAHSADPERAARLGAELRCVVCQNQSIAESSADIALALRRQIDEQIAAGRSDAQIRAFMVARYGEFVLYRPPFKAATALLWLGPALLLIGGFVLLRNSIARGAGEADAPSWTDHERARASDWLRDEHRDARR